MKFLNPKLMLILIFIIAASFRVFFLDLIEFKYDEAFTVFQMEQFFVNPYLMQVGPPQSTGVYNPPLFNYIMIFLSAFSREPQFLSFMIALINSVSVVFFYLVVRDKFGDPAGLFSALFLALSPWGIIFSRKVWIPDLILPFVVFFLYFYLKRSILPLFITLALLIQMHASGLFFTAATILGFIIAREKFEPKKVTMGFLIGSIPAIPYIVRQLSSTPFCIDCTSFLNYQALPKPYDPSVFIRPFQLLGGLNFEVLMGSDFIGFIQSLPQPVLILFWPVMLLPVLGSALLAKQKEYKILAFLPFIMSLLYFLARTPSYMHYFVILLPVVALLSGIAIKFTWEFKGKASKLILVTSAFVFLFADLAFILGFYQFISVKQVIAGDYGQVFPKTREFVENETLDYRLFSEYPLIKSYAYMFAKPELIHGKLGELFMQSNNANLAISEFRKALEKNPKDTFSRGNLAYIYIMTGKESDAQKELAVLESFDSTMSAKLKIIIENSKDK